MAGTSAREESLDAIQRELTAFARRARATAARMHPELSLVSYTILAHLEEQQGCRATDLAAHYLLDKSTVSRQVASLERLGFIERRTDPADQRVQVLHLAPRGTAVLAAAQVSRHRAFDERLADWDPQDLARFAAYLRRYNAAAATHPWPQPEAAGTRTAGPQTAGTQTTGPRATGPETAGQTTEPQTTGQETAGPQTG